MLNKVLIIENDESVLKNLSEILVLAGYNVYRAMNGKVGIELAIKEEPNIILCSEILPELDGYGVLKIISKDENLRKIPVIFMSPKSCNENFRAAMNLGADDYLSIPFKDVQLLESIETRLRKFKFFNPKKMQDNIGNIDTLFNYNNAKIKMKSLYNQEDIQIFSAKESLYHTGGIPNAFYWLKKGMIKTYMINEQGKELITGLYGPGDLVGLIDLFGSNTYVENAKFIDDGMCVMISRKNFLQAIITDRDIAMYIYSKLNFSVNIRKERLLYMAYNSVRKRTADCLIWLCHIYNKENKYPFHINFSREDLASLVGTAKESVIRMLSNFKEEGIIETHSSELVILDRGKLDRVIG